MLTSTYTLNFIDRQILIILQEPIKIDLGLSDTELGLLTGPAFGLFYAIMSIPIARWADVSNRKNIITLSLVLWSAMTFIAGLTVNFIQILATRIGVGIGQAGASPPAHSIISDYFPPEKRSTALSIYSMGISFGILLSFVIGGFIAENYGWRVAFLILGVPGLLFAIPLYFTVKEPLKGASDTIKNTQQTPFWKAIKILFAQKTFVWVVLGAGFQAFCSFGVISFLPSFLSRIHGVPIVDIGIYLGITTGFGGAIGMFLGGYMTDKLRARDLRWYLWLPALTILLYMLPNLIIFFSSNVPLIIFMLFIANIVGSFYLGPTIALTHSLANAQMRSLTSAILFFAIGIIGITLSPLVIGMLSDWLQPTYGATSLRWAFLSTFAMGLAAAGMYYWASRSYLDELRYFLVGE